MFYFMQSFEEREAINEGFQNYLDTTKSTKTYKQDFRPNVLIANIRVIKFGLNFTRDNKMILMKSNSSAQIKVQICAREHRFDQSREIRVYRLYCFNVPQRKVTLNQQIISINFTSEMYNPEFVDIMR